MGSYLDLKVAPLFLLFHLKDAIGIPGGLALRFMCEVSLAGDQTYVFLYKVSYCKTIYYYMNLTLYNKVQRYPQKANITAYGLAA